MPDAEDGTRYGVTARAGGGLDAGSEPDPGAPVLYTWTASAGTLADPGAATTTYDCPRGNNAGPQLVQVTASRGPCTITQQAVIVCFDDSAASSGSGGAPVGGGLGGAGGAASADGGPGAAGRAGTDRDAEAKDGDSNDNNDDAGPTVVRGCGLDPTIDEGPACNQCTTENCTTLESAQPGVPIAAGCHHLASDAQRQSCQALYCCLRSQHCVVNGDPTACWCGSADPVKCALGSEAANGPCLREIQTAAGSDQAPQIALRMVDPSFPLGGAINLATCRATYCASPPAPACQGF